MRIEVMRFDPGGSGVVYNPVVHDVGDVPGLNPDTGRPAQDTGIVPVGHREKPHRGEPLLHPVQPLIVATEADNALR